MIALHLCETCHSIISRVYKLLIISVHQWLYAVQPISPTLSSLFFNQEAELIIIKIFYFTCIKESRITG